MSEVADKSTPRPWQEGEGRVVYYGEVEQTEKYPSGTYALLEFPKGPIGVTFGDIWRETPMRLIPVNSYPALEKCREALKPFASYLEDRHLDRLPDNTVVASAGTASDRARITAGDLRAAKAALAQLSETEKG